ncbi:MAG TPA: hypothetical protein VLW52_02110 [Opitutaceae bacterium]|nr:hypothetical protein [Opitutaceae bacterium]
MRSYKNHLLVVLAVVVVGLATLAWRQHRELVALRATTLAAGGNADWQKRLSAASKRMGSAGNRSTPRPGGPVATALPGAASGPTPLSAIRNPVPGFTSLMERPEAARLLAIQQKAQINARYAGLFRQLALSPDKLAQFKSLLADKLSTPIDVLAAASQQGIDPVRNPEEFRQLNQNAQAELDEKIKDLLEPAGYSQYQTYLQMEPQRAVVNQLQQALSYSDTPLTAAQADRLVQILAETSPASGAGATAGASVGYFSRAGANANVTIALGPPPPDGAAIFGGSQITDDAITRVQGILATAQIQALQEIQQQQQAVTQLRQLMFQNAGAGHGPVIVPPTGGPLPGPLPPPGG